MPVLSPRVVAFSFRDLAVNLAILGPNDSIRNVAVVILDAFDDGAALLNVGSTFAPESILKASEIRATVAGEYRNEETQLVAALRDAHVYLFVHAGTSSRGHGRVYFNMAVYGPKES